MPAPDQRAEGAPGSTSHIYGCEYPQCREKGTVEVQVWDHIRGWVWHAFCRSHEPSSLTNKRRMLDA